MSKFLNSIENWCNCGDRVAQITLSSGKEPKIYLLDRNALFGKHVTQDSILPTTKELIALKEKLNTNL